MPPLSSSDHAGRPTVLHYTGYTDDRSGIAAVVREIAGANRFDCLLGVSRGFVAHRRDVLPTVKFSAVAPDTIGAGAFWRSRRVAREAFQWLEADSRRIFHGHSRAGLLTALWLRRWGQRRIVTTVHVYGRQRWFYRWAATHLRDRLFWLSPSMKAYYGAGDSSWSECLPNAIAASPRMRTSVRTNYERLVIGGAGMLVRWKGWHLLLEAIAQLPEPQRRRIEFRHIGAPDHSSESGAYATELMAQTARLGLETQVKWLGWQPSSKLLLGEVDLVAVPSRLEPFSMIALEALFAGVPVLAADDGGPRDFVREGVNGWFFKSGDARDLARVLSDLLVTEAWTRLRIAPEELQRFTAPVASEAWLQAYRSALAAAAVGSG